MSKEQELFDLLKNKFGSRAVAAAIIGNMDVETGGSFAYDQKQYKGGPGRGVLQMEGQMLKSYQSYLKRNKIDDSLNSQIDFLHSALTSDKDYDIGAGHRKKLQEAFKTEDIDLITEEFSNRFLRPGIPHLDRRKKAAWKWNDSLSMLNPFGSNAYAAELEFDLSRAVPSDEEGNIMPLEFDLTRAVPERTDVPQLRELPADYKMPEPTDQDALLDLEFAANRIAEQGFEAVTGFTPEEGELGKKKFEKGMSVAISATLMGPIYAAMFEVYRQGKSAVVSALKDEDYSPLEQRALSELIPDDINKWIRGAASVGEVVGDIALISSAASLAKQGTLKDTIKIVGKKLEDAGYGTGKVTIPKDAIKQAAKGTTLEQNAKAWAQAKMWKPKPMETPATPLKIGAAPTPPPVAAIAPIKPADPTKMSKEEWVKSQVGDVVRSEGVLPKEGEPFKFEYIKNLEKAPFEGRRYRQDIEPAGRFLTVGKAENVKDLPNYETGIIEFNNPLVVDFGGGYESGTNWKDVLSERYGGKTGKKLTEAIKKDGYDGIVTISTSADGKTQYTSEIVDLTFGKRKLDTQQLEAEWEKAQVTAEEIPPISTETFTAESEFVQQPKVKTDIRQYFTPAEYHLKQLGFETKIGKPVREALMDFDIEFAKKSELVVETHKEHIEGLKAVGKEKEFEASKEKVWQLMDKGIPEGDTSLEANIARKYRVQTKEMLVRMNELNRRIGKDEVREVKDYILHMLHPEILNEIYSKGVIPPELAKVMQYIPTKNLFLRTMQERKGVPEEWLVKDPHELMRAMFAIDLRYIYLQDALAKIDPYLQAVKEGEWSPETFLYVDDWIKQAVKMRPSNIDVLVNNMMEATIAPILRQSGVKISNMPWRDFVSTLSSAMHTGALGMRVRPILRNLVQSTFDWVMYGTKPYLKARNQFNGILTGDKASEAFKILNESKVWRTRMPMEAQSKEGLNKLFSAGSLGYRASDLHNVGIGILTRYNTALDRGMSHKEAIEWADDDLPSTQWSYRREDLPRAYWTTTGRALWTLGSWWMNFYFRFLPEIVNKTFMGKDVMGRAVSQTERLAGLRFLMLVGTLFAIRETSKEMTGTAVDYTGQVRPPIFGESPIAKSGFALRDFTVGLATENDRMKNEGLKELINTMKLSIPFALATEDLIKLMEGDKDIADFLFYTKKDKKKKGRPKI